MAADLAVGIPAAGLLISAFAAGMVVGAPLLAAATLRLPAVPRSSPCSASSGSRTWWAR